MALTTVQSGMMDSIAQYNSFKNRIINGGMVIDQRNSGAAQNNLAVGWVYTVDRWEVYSNNASRFNSQQNKGAVTPPAGFKNYLGVSVNTGYTPSAADYNILAQPIEGFNTADLGFGAAGAATVTLSFWVYSSISGTHSGFLANNTLTTSYPFTFSVTSANTWTQISVSIIGSTSGTWVGATNGIGLYVGFNLGNGSNYQTGTPNIWGGTLIQPSSAVSIVGTSGATFYITGVQLEKGSTATAFDYRPYGTELQLCQRYYIQYQVLPQSSQRMWVAAYGGSALPSPPITIPQYMRASPSYSFLNTTIQYYSGAGVWTNATMAIYSLDYQSTSAVPYAFTVYVLCDSSAGVNRLVWNPTGITYAYISSEL